MLTHATRLGDTSWFLPALLAVAMPTAFDLTAAEVSTAVHVDGAVSFSLRDFRGREWSPADFAESKLLVVAFLGTECPIAKLYAGRLAELEQQYAKRAVAFVGVVSNRQDSIAEIAHFARLHKIGFPLLKDLNNVLADRLAAERTPEVFVLDGDRAVRYRGRIDDQYHYGAARRKAEQDYLVRALEELLAGKTVSTPRTEAVGCHIGRVLKPDETAPVTYSNQVSRILQARCVKCHRKGEIAPFALTEYREVAGWAEMIAEVVREQRMPPWQANPAHEKFRNDARLSGEEKELIYQWVAAGAPEGNPSDLPEQPHFAAGWQIGEPDEIIYAADEPFRVPAEGDVDYQYFVVDPGWREDKWIQAAECRPGNRAVVHHIDVVARGSYAPKDGALLRVAGMSPGLPAQVFPPGYARLVPAGSKLVFEIHYTACGSEQDDRSCLGVVFADPRTVRHRIATRAPYNDDFRIPPGAADHVVEFTYRFRRDEMLWSLYPHMHLRGKSFRYTATYPGGRQEVLLDVPRYDFNWQLSYELAEPKRMPAGTTVHCVAHFDNSADNPANPDPTKEVRWGAQNWDEMMYGYMDVATVVPKRGDGE